MKIICPFLHGRRLRIDALTYSQLVAKFPYSESVGPELFDFFFTEAAKSQKVVGFLGGCLGERAAGLCCLTYLIVPRSHVEAPPFFLPNYIAHSLIRPPKNTISNAIKGSPDLF